MVPKQSDIILMSFYCKFAIKCVPTAKNQSVLLVMNLSGLVFIDHRVYDMRLQLQTLHACNQFPFLQRHPAGRLLRCRRLKTLFLHRARRSTF